MTVALQICRRQQLLQMLLWRKCCDTTAQRYTKRHLFCPCLQRKRSPALEGEVWRMLEDFEPCRPSGQITSVSNEEAYLHFCLSWHCFMLQWSTFPKCFVHAPVLRSSFLDAQFSILAKKNPVGHLSKLVCNASLLRGSLVFSDTRYRVLRQKVKFVSAKIGQDWTKVLVLWLFPYLFFLLGFPLWALLFGVLGVARPEFGQCKRGGLSFIAFMAIFLSGTYDISKHKAHAVVFYSFSCSRYPQNSTIHSFFLRIKAEGRRTITILTKELHPHPHQSAVDWTKRRKGGPCVK